MIANWLRSFFGGKAARSGRESRAARRRPFRPRLEALEDRLAPAVHTWTGQGANTNWTTNANWVVEGSGLVIVQAPDSSDDVLRFPAGALATTNVNNFPAGTTFSALEFTGGNYSLSGNRIKISAQGITANVGFHTLGLDIEIPDGADTDITVAGGATLSIGSATGGVISGGADVGDDFATLHKKGAGRLQFNRDNSYLALTIIDEGILRIRSNDALGGDETGSSPVHVAVGAALELDGNLTIRALLNILGSGPTGQGALRSISGNSVITGSHFLFLFADPSIGVDSGSTLTFSDVDMGSTLGWSKTGAGRLTISSPQSYGGQVILSQGTLAIQHRTALGSAGGGVVAAPGTTLELDAGLIGFTIENEPLTLNGGTLRNISANNSWSGPVTLGSTSTINVASGTALTIDGQITGNAGAGLTKVGAGDLTFAGSLPNTYNGTTQVDDGRLFLNKPAGTTAIAGSLTVGNGSGPEVLVRLQSDNQIPNTSNVRVNGEGRFDLNGRIEGINSLTLQGGTVTTGLAGTLLVINNVESLAASAPSTISGKLSLASGPQVFNVANGSATDDLIISAEILPGGQSPVKHGTGTMVLTGNSSYTGTTRVEAGTLRVEGSLASPVVVAGGNLTGNGTVGSLTVQSGGTLSPGRPNDNTAVFHVNGNLVLQTGATYVVNLSGPVAGTGHDQLDVQGTVSLGGATLSATVGSSSNVGNNFRIIENDGNDNPSGQFSGLSQGEFFNSSNGVRLSIDYFGGFQGNDVVLEHKNTGSMFPNRAITPVLDEGGIATLTGTTFDVDPNDRFFLDINWGDGTTETRVFGPSAPRIVSIPHRYRESGTYTIQLAWRDQHGDGNSGTLTTTVRNVAPQVFAGLPAFLRPGQPLNRIGLFTDPGRDSWTATVDYGDGSGPQSLDLNGHFFRLAHRYTQEGTYTVTVTVRDDDGGVGTDRFQVHVRERSADLLAALFDLFDDSDRRGHGGR